MSYESGGVISYECGREQLIMNEGLIMSEAHYVMDVLLMFEISYKLGRERQTDRQTDRQTNRESQM